MNGQRKKEIRKEIREKKKLYSLSEKENKSKAIFDKLEQLKLFEDAQIVMAYWSMEDEVFTHEFILKWFKEKQIVLPVVKGDKLELKLFRGLENMEKGESYGIGEPTGEVFTQFEKIDLIIVPGVAFDKDNNRLGRGKAYYDKLLNLSKVFKLGVCFDFQLLSSVPTDGHDVKMDMVICD